MTLPKPSSCAGCPLYEPPYGKHTGFSYRDGQGNKGVMIIAEALGEEEEKAGVGLVGKSGYFVFNNLHKVGLERDDFWIANTIFCRPPSNFLVKAPYEVEAIAHCSSNLDAVIAQSKAEAEAKGLHFIILTLGKTAFKRVMGYHDKDSIMKDSYTCYPHYNQQWDCFVLAIEHPSYMMRGNGHLIPILQFVAQRAVEIARDGLTLETPNYLLDPAPFTFSVWVKDYLKAVEADPTIVLSYDIETPYKCGADEDKLEGEGDDYTILRCSFAYRAGEAVSVPWTASYRPYIEALFNCHGDKTSWNGEQYDNPRILAQMPIKGNTYDAMLMWHVLNSSLPKSLGFVTPFYNKQAGMWKHLSESEPARYNAEDALRGWGNFQGIRKNLIENGQWEVFEKHIVQLNQVLNYISSVGVLRDEEMRATAEATLKVLLDDLEQQMEAAVPPEARKFKVYKKTPKDTSGMVQLAKVQPVKRCSTCSLLNPKKTHFKATSAKKHKLGQDNICEDATVVVADEEVMLWAKPLEFKVSKVSLLDYQKVLKHQAIINRKESRVTFDEDALDKLIKKYPKDPLYPLIATYRGYQKLLGVYFGETQYEEVLVSDDYQLKPGEKLADAI